MKILFSILACLMVFATMFSQQDNCDCSSKDDFNNHLLNNLTGIEYINPVSGYKGQQYFEKWLLGEVILSNGETLHDIDLRFDLFLGDLLWNRKSDFKTGIFTRSDVRQFKLYKESAADTAVFENHRILLPLASDSSDVFLQCLVKGNLTLYAYRKVVKVTDPYELIDNTKYLIVQGNDNYWLSLTKANLLKIAAINKNEMKKVIRSGKLALSKNENAFIKALCDYNRLVKN